MQNKVKKLLMTLVASSTLITSSSALATPPQTFSNVFTFGDSFSTPANSWSALVTEHYGSKYVVNQTNFALDGASTNSLSPELSTYKANVKTFDPNALYMMYMGPNDADFILIALRSDLSELLFTRGLTFDQIMSGVKDGSLTSNDFPDTTAEVVSRGNNVGEFIKNISDGGAKYIVVLNHFNESYRQFILGGTDEEENFAGGFLSNSFNQAIYSAINKSVPSANVIYADYARLVAELSTKPSNYFIASELVNTYKNQGVFDSTSHPTSAAHKITAQYVLSVIESPSRIAYVREIPIAIGENVAQNIRSKSYDLTMNESEKFSGDINGNYLDFHTKSKTVKDIGIKKSDTSEIAANFNYKLADNLVVGFGINGDKSNMSFKNNNGKAEIKELLLTLNGTYRFDNPIFVYGAIGSGWIKYDIKRQINLGQAVRIEQGKPRGMHYMATIGTGYQYDAFAETNLTPFVNVNYQKVSINSYTEKGELHSTTMSFNIPDRKSVITEIGARIDGNVNLKENISVTPSLTLTYGYDFINPMKQAKAKVSDMPRQFVVPTYKTDRSYFGINGELSAQTYNINYGIRAESRLRKNTKFWSAGLFCKYSF
ncbi:MAG TPA: autotransporter domain-containing protein [Rickettsia endosymbiont of Diachasma alloeum]|nr:autotransporter domain-containing protein [Rickettsia endosymbiont of Diachasma alloeum]